MSAVLGLHYKVRKLFPNKQTYFSVRELGVLCVSKALLINANGQWPTAKSQSKQVPLTGTDAAEREQKANLFALCRAARRKTKSGGFRGWVTQQRWCFHHRYIKSNKDLPNGIFIYRNIVCIFCRFHKGKDRFVQP